MSQQLDRSKPLWEMWIVEGLEGGDRFAMITQDPPLHGRRHVERRSARGAAHARCRPTTVEPPPRWVPRPAPTLVGAAAATRRGAAPRLPLRDGCATFRESSARRAGPALRRARHAARGARHAAARAAAAVSDTPLNRPIGPHRRFDWLAMSLDDVKAVKNRLGGTLNDVVLATVAGAVQRFLEEPARQRRGARLPRHGAGERAHRGRARHARQPRLGLDRRPAASPSAIRAGGSSRSARPRPQLKDAKQALGAEMLTQVAEWTPSTLLSLGSRMVMRALPFNLVVTNVPGPQVPLYLLGARMLDNYGQVPLTDYLGLGIVLFSYAGKLCWGFTADWDLLPDLHDFVTE